jgi:hypothetical protein
MHQIVLLTALTAMTGLFGGSRHCGTGTCYRPAYRHAYTYSAPYARCGRAYGTCGTYAAAPAAPYTAPMAAAPQAAQAPVAPTVQVARRATYSTYNYYYAPQSSCPNGQCYRR